MEENSKQKDWLKSKEAKQSLKISDCELKHLRVDGKLSFKKKGNAFLYAKEDVKSISKNKK